MAMNFLWTELEADLSGSVFATMNVKWLEKCRVAYPTVDCFILWSDNCTYQNKNRFVSAALLLFNKRTNIEVIQKYLIRGHTQMEADNVHSRIGQNKKGRRIHLPSDYISVIETASKNKKYQVEMLEYDYFDDYNKINVIPDIKPKNGVVIDVHAYKYSGGEIYYKFHHADE